MDLTKVLSVVKSKKTGFFAAGVLFGTAGIKALSSKDAKKLYTNATAAVLRAKECVMDTNSATDLMFDRKFHINSFFFENTCRK